MSISKATPGPWHATTREDDVIGRHWEVRDAEGAPICGVTLSEANARLIAAAPEMRAILDVLAEGPSQHVNPYRMCEVARTLLARIDGTGTEGSQS